MTSGMKRADSAIAAGVVVGQRYEILEKLGEGGFGEVWKARQLTTARLVAIKILRLSEGRGALARDRRIARFQREMRLCAQLHHPNIVGLVDTGTMPDERPFSVFAFAPGQDLAGVLAAEGALSPAEARYLMLQVLDALAAAHALGVIHRDLKPANLMVIPTGARRNALVLDFGIGAIAEGALEEGGEDAARITGTNEMLGTPAYSAPEQFRGHPATPRSDLYAWGLVFLECLTGQRIFEGASVAEVIFKQLDAEPVSMPGWLRAHPLGAILERVVSKDPAARGTSAEALLRALEACDLRGLGHGAPGHHGGGAHGGRAQAAIPTETLVVARGGGGGARGERALPATVVSTQPGQTGSGPRLLRGERRQLTALCCAFTVSSSATTALDLDDLDDLLRAQQEHYTEVARREGGHLAGALGDQLLLYFGVPAAREDDALRAARVAVEIAEHGRREQARLAAERGIVFEVRVGLHTGLVVSSDAGDSDSLSMGSIVGTTPRIAARLGALAPAGEAEITRETRKVLRDRFLVEPAGARVLEHGAPPVETFRLVRERRSEETAASLATPGDVPLVGREQELTLLLGRWARARDGAGESVFITGEAGIGKSRLTQELARRLAREPHTWLECRTAPDSRSSALYPIIDLLERRLELSPELTPEARLTRLEALLARYGFELAEAVPLLAALLSLPPSPLHPPLDLAPQRQKELTLATLTSLVLEMAEREPVVFLLEDLHWADPTSLELVAQLVAEAGSARLCVLTTARPDFTPPWTSSGMLQIQLARLPRAEVEQIVAAVTRGRPLPPHVLEHLVARTDGIPLFVEELARMVLETETTSRAGLDLSIPSTLRDSLTARLDRLGRARETAQVAAALGREFSHELLRAVSPLGEAALEEDLTQLVEAGILQRKRRLKSHTFLFKHALVRDTAYESLRKSTRQAVHARIAGVLEARFPETVKTRPELLAQHHAAAEQPHKAIAYARQAAMGALQRSANVEAVQHVTQALGWLDALTDAHTRAEAELELHGLLTPALMATRGYGAPQVEAAVRRSSELIERIERDGRPSPHVFPTLWTSALYHAARGRNAEALAVAERCLALAERASDVEQEVMALPLVGQCLFTAGRFAEARACFERTLGRYDRKEHGAHVYAVGQDARSSAENQLGVLLWFQGFPDQALAQASAAVAWARELGHAESLATATAYLGGVHHYRREPVAAGAAGEAIVELAERHGLELWQAIAGLLGGWARGDVAGPVEILAELRAVGLEVTVPYWSSTIAESEARLGHLDDALGRLDECLRLAEDRRELYYAPELHRLRGVYLLARGVPGDAAAAEQSLRQAVALAASQGARMLELRAATALYGALSRRGSRAEAKQAGQALEALVAWFTEGHDTDDLLEARASLAASIPPPEEART